MEPGKTHCIVIANNVLNCIENTEEIPAPDGGTVKLLSLCPVQFKLEDLGIKYFMGNTIIKTIEKNVSMSFPLLRDIEVLLSREGDPKKFLSLPAYVSIEKAIGQIIDITNIGKGLVKLLIKRYVGGGHIAREIWERPLNTVFPLVEHSVVFLKNLKNYGIKNNRAGFIYATSSDLFTCLAASRSSNMESVVSVRSMYGKTYDVKEVDIVIPDFLLEKRSKDEKVKEVPLLSLSSKNTELSIFRPAVDNKDEFTGDFSRGDLVFVNIENINFLATVVEKPSDKNHMYLGVKFYSPRVQDEVVLVDGECGLYVSPQCATPVEASFLASAGISVLVKDFDFNGVNLSGESGRILLDRNANESSVLVEFKKDIGGSSADGIGSPGRCARVPVECIRYVAYRGTNVSSFLYNGVYITVTPDAQEILDKVPRETIAAIQSSFEAKNKVENIIGTVMNIKEAGNFLTETGRPQLLICQNTIIPTECIIGLKTRPVDVLKMLKSKDLSKVSLEMVDEVLRTQHLTDVQIDGLEKIREGLRRRNRILNIPNAPLTPVAENRTQAEETEEIEEEEEDLEEYTDDEDYDEGLDEIEEEYFE